MKAKLSYKERSFTQIDFIPAMHVLCGNKENRTDYLEEERC